MTGLQAADRHRPNVDIKYLDECLRPSRNNFVVLRLVASLAVIFGHSYALSPTPVGTEPLELLLKFDYSGSLAVKFFFFLSGLLVVHSALNSPNAIRFLTKRLLRIFPGLLVCNFITVVIIGTILTNIPVDQYLRATETWKYFLHDTLLFDFQWTLPGVMPQAKYGLNGSLWTLPKEMDCYILVAILCALGAFSVRNLLAICFSGLALLSIFYPMANPRFNYSEDMYYLPFCFAVGALAAIYCGKIRLRLEIAVALRVTLWFVDIKHIQQFIFYIALFYSAILLACDERVVRYMKLPFDASYGVYIYGFLIQQIMFQNLPTLNFHVQQIGAMLVATAVGILSWYVVEKPAITFGKKLFSGARGDNRSLVFTPAIPSTSATTPAIQAE